LNIGFASDFRNPMKAFPYLFNFTQYTFNGMGLTMKNESIMPVGEMIKQYKAGVLKIL